MHCICLEPVWCSAFINITPRVTTVLFRSSFRFISYSLCQRRSPLANALLALEILQSLHICMNVPFVSSVPHQYYSVLNNLHLSYRRFSVDRPTFCLLSSSVYKYHLFQKRAFLFSSLILRDMTFSLRWLWIILFACMWHFFSDSLCTKTSMNYQTTSRLIQKDSVLHSAHVFGT